MGSNENDADGVRRQSEAPAGAAGREFEQGALLAGKYLVRALLGRGGMGEVYLVEAPSGALRAAKVMTARENATLADLQSFRREAIALLNLGTHPFVVRLY